jgi:hypothetical protein
MKEVTGRSNRAPQPEKQFFRCGGRRDAVKAQLL